MLTLPSTIKVYLGAEAIDLRKSFDALASITREVMQKDPLSGHLFVFLNRRADRIKILFWDRSGYCLLYQRLEKGVFKRPLRPDAGLRHVELEPAQLMLMLEGIDLTHATQRVHWQPLLERMKNFINSTL